MKISKKGLDLIKQFEGCELKAYRCAAGTLTIGIGHTTDVFEGMSITQEQADNFLLKDIEWAEDAVNGAVDVPLSQYYFDALVSFVFNVGQSAFYESTLLKLLNTSKYAEALDQLLRWDKVDGESVFGLTKRRKAERTLGYSQPFPKQK